MGASHEATSRQYRLLNLASCRRNQHLPAPRASSSATAWSAIGSSRPCVPATPPASWRITVLAEEADAAYDRVGLTGYTEHWDRARLALPGNDYAGDELGRSCGSAPGSPRSTAPPRPSSPRTANASTTTRWCSRPAPTPSCRRCRATTCRAATSIAPSTTSTRSATTRRARRAGQVAGRRGDRWRAARPRGRQCAALVRPARPRRRDGAAADGPAARRGRRCAAEPDDRRPGHHVHVGVGTEAIRRRNAIGP